MNRKTAPVVLALLSVAGASAWGAEPEAVVVENRSYTTDSRLEVGVLTDLSINNSLTSVENFQLVLTYHLTENWAIDLIGGYAIGGPTDLQCEAQNPSSGSNCGPNKGTSIFKNVGASPASKSDLPNLWVLSGPNLMAGIKWEPVYGKLSLLTELPVHFKWFLTVDGGAAQFGRTSVDICTQYQNGDCGFNQGAGYYDTLYQQQWSWLASAATGLRFIFLGRASFEAALRDYVWADSYLTNFTGQDSVNGTPKQATLASGLTNSIFADLGFTWTF